MENNIDEDKEKIFEIGNRIGYAVGTKCTDEEIEYFNKFLEDYKYKEKELETYKKIAERYERECKMFRAFCRKIRKDEKRNVDEFNQGREYSYIQFLNLLEGEQNWEHEGKYFDEVDKELIEWARKEVENDNNR